MDTAHPADQNKEAVMNSQFFSGYIRALFIVFAGLLLFAGFPSDAVSMDKTKGTKQNDIQPVGIISPDGATNLWPVSKLRGSAILGLLAKYPAKMIEGVKFYKLSSWPDMARILTAVNEHQAQIIRHLAQDVQELKKRVGILEKKKMRIVHSGSINDRVEALEKKVRAMNDPGNP